MSTSVARRSSTRRSSKTARLDRRAPSDVRGSADRVCSGLYLGDEEASKNKDLLTKLGITHVVALQHGPKEDFCHFQRTFKYNYCRSWDWEGQDLISHFSSIGNWIHNAIEDEGRVFVHCRAGVSRSATIVIAYLMEFHNLSYKAALGRVKSKRPVIDPNDGFRTQLQMYELMGCCLQGKSEGHKMYQTARVMWHPWDYNPDDDSSSGEE